MNMPSGPNTSISPYHKNERICHMSDYDDDGETHAGQRLLHLLLISRVENVAVIVSRWYGGIQLGPDRFKHINNAAKLLLVQQGFITSDNAARPALQEECIVGDL
ncbi:unnamed protein product [Protopolystoma xenopodis]|uniref:Impact N-terminal domain-containing protein n=1 Tax=Protopolystoma xenopodis TaxID=117903 RepID=A0A3S5B224_9PLAT|nr:unnamed protein product [Protopolystoma xenopodis]